MAKARLLIASGLAAGLLSGCSQSAYDECFDKAQDEYLDLQSQVAENGGDVGGVWDNIEGADQYAIDQCTHLYEGE